MPANKDVDGRKKSGHDELSGQPRLSGRVMDVRLRGCAIPARSRGRGEMVDARDLKSLGSNFPCRFKSGRPHQGRIILLLNSAAAPFDLWRRR